MSAGDWLPIPGWHGRYEVSISGEVRSLDRVTTKGQRMKGKVLAPNVMKSGYRMISMWEGSRRTARTIHRLVMEAAHGPCPDGYEVCHRNGDRADNRLENLYYGTRSENNRDKVRHGTDHNARKTHCKQGHEFSVENTYRRPRGGRACKRCHANRWARKKASAAIERAHK